MQALQNRGCRAAGLPCDVADATQVKALADLALSRFGRLDVWVNNAGLSAPYGPTLSVAPERFMQVIHTNIVGVYNGSFVAMQHFVGQGQGKLINIFGRGDKGPQPFQNAYASSKYWVSSFTRALAKEYKDSGAEVIGYNPGLVITDLLTEVEAAPGYEKQLQQLPRVVGWWGNPPAVPARKLVWLASAATDGRTGLIVNELTAVKIVAGLARAGVRSLLRQPAPNFPMTIRTA